jgi:dienelactone hydrolase
MAASAQKRLTDPREVQIDVGPSRLSGELVVPESATGIVLFAHGSGSSRSPRNQFVARVINEAGIGTLLFDLLTRQEEAIDSYTREFRFNIHLLAKRLVTATDWLSDQSRMTKLVPGYFGASTGGAAAVVAAAALGNKIGAVVSRGGRPDLAWEALSRVKAPTLLIVGGLDGSVIQLNEKAHEQLSCPKELKIVPGATHLFEEPGKLEEVANLAAEWFSKHLK